MSKRQEEGHFHDLVIFQTRASILSPDGRIDGELELIVGEKVRGRLENYPLVYWKHPSQRSGGQGSRYRRKIEDYRHAKETYGGGVKDREHRNQFSTLTLERKGRSRRGSYVSMREGGGQESLQAASPTGTREGDKAVLSVQCQGQEMCRLLHADVVLVDRGDKGKGKKRKQTLLLQPRVKAGLGSQGEKRPIPCRKGLPNPAFNIAPWPVPRSLTRRERRIAGKRREQKKDEKRDQNDLARKSEGPSPGQNPE